MELTKADYIGDMYRYIQPRTHTSVASAQTRTSMRCKDIDMKRCAQHNGCTYKKEKQTTFKGITNCNCNYPPIYVNYGNNCLISIIYH